jgi:hypothetical protein
MGENTVKVYHFENPPPMLKVITGTNLFKHKYIFFVSEDYSFLN